MRRVPEVIDCWYDSRRDAVCPVGLSARRAREKFASSSRPTSSAKRSIRPAAGSTASWRSARCCSARSEAESAGEADNPHSAIRTPQSPIPHPFRNCIVLGLMLGEDGQKMSKSKRNYREPSEIFDTLRGRRAALVLLRQSAAVDDDPLQRAGDQGQHPRVPAAALELLSASS